MSYCVTASFFEIQVSQFKTTKYLFIDPLLSEMGGRAWLTRRSPQFKVVGTELIMEKTSSLLFLWPAGMVNAQPNLAFDLVTHLTDKYGPLLSWALH